MTLTYSPGIPPTADAAVECASELPPVTSWPRRVLKHPALMHYNRLAGLVITVNLIIAIAVLTSGGFTTQQLSNAAVINFTVAIAIRQQYVINLLFWLATRAPTTWPLKVRWTLGKVYHFGGVHVGGALAGTGWFLALLTALLTSSAPTAIALVSIALAVTLVGIVATAVPPFRTRFHDRFEKVHRFGGWTALVLFWTLTLLVAAEGNDSLLTSPAVWLLIVVTVSVALPWLRLRRVPVHIERPSSHVALAKFDHGVTPFAGSSTAVSRSPLLEWHSFANVPSPGQSGFRLTISRAGDWTGSFIDDAPDHVWVKGITTAGVANIETLFRRVVYVATGSGIGPCLPHLLAAEVPARLVWSTRSPRETYGDTLVDGILAAQPNALIWDTSVRGKPDMVQLAYDAYQAFDAEAVICISNKKLTWQVVHGLERRGIPAYGAIWDS